MPRLSRWQPLKLPRLCRKQQLQMPRLSRRHPPELPRLCRKQPPRQQGDPEAARSGWAGRTAPAKAREPSPGTPAPAPGTARPLQHQARRPHQAPHCRRPRREEKTGREGEECQGGCWDWQPEATIQPAPPRDRCRATRMQVQGSRTWAGCSRARMTQCCSHGRRWTSASGRGALPVLFVPLRPRQGARPLHPRRTGGGGTQPPCAPPFSRFGPQWRSGRGARDRPLAHSLAAWRPLLPWIGRPPRRPDGGVPSKSTPPASRQHRPRTTRRRRRRNPLLCGGPLTLLRRRQRSVQLG